MSKFIEYVKTHIPETVSVAVMILVFVVMSIYAAILNHKVSENGKNPFDEPAKPAFVINAENVSEQEDTLYSGNYYTVGNGKKYHLPDCSYVRNSKDVNEISADTIDKYGYEPCKQCIK